MKHSLVWTLLKKPKQDELHAMNKGTVAELINRWKIIAASNKTTDSGKIFSYLLPGQSISWLLKKENAIKAEYIVAYVNGEKIKSSL